MKTIELRVEGMACSGCENSIQNALKEIEGVEEVVASHVNKTVKVTLKDDVSEDVIKETIESLDYEVIG